MEEGNKGDGKALMEDRWIGELHTYGHHLISADEREGENTGCWVSCERQRDRVSLRFFEERRCVCLFLRSLSLVLVLNT